MRRNDLPFMPRDGSIPLLTPLKLIFLPARRDARMKEQREREREGGEGNRVEKGSGRSGKYISRRDVIPGTLSRGKSRMPRN